MTFSVFFHYLTDKGTYRYLITLVFSSFVGIPVVVRLRTNSSMWHLVIWTSLSFSSAGFPNEGSYPHDPVAHPGMVLDLGVSTSPRVDEVAAVIRLESLRALQDSQGGSEHGCYDNHYRLGCHTHPSSVLVGDAPLDLCLPSAPCSVEADLHILAEPQYLALQL